MLRESIQHYELSRPDRRDDAADLEAAVRRVLLDVRRAVDDFEPMQGAIFRMIKVTRDGAARYSKEEIDEAVAFLEWLLDLNFVFLGYREYRIAPGAPSPSCRWFPDRARHPARRSESASPRRFRCLRCGPHCGRATRAAICW